MLTQRQAVHEQMQRYFNPQVYTELVRGKINQMSPANQKCTTGCHHNTIVQSYIFTNQNNLQTNIVVRHAHYSQQASQLCKGNCIRATHKWGCRNTHYQPRSYEFFMSRPLVTPCQSRTLCKPQQRKAYGRAEHSIWMMLIPLIQTSSTCWRTNA